MTRHTLSASGISVTLDLAIGHIAALEIAGPSGPIHPLHRAPWADDMDATTPNDPPNIRGLSGDFLCAPFGGSDVEPSPPHGWTANSSWSLVDERQEGDTHSATYRLDRAVLGATVFKHFTLRDGHPFLYQRHAFVGGAGSVPVAHHAMVHMDGQGELSFSDKQFAETPKAWPEPKRALAYPARADLSSFPAATGESIDLRRWPWAARNEDFVMLAEAAGNALGWTAIARTSEGATTLILKSPRELPVTILWSSNGGRDDAPWLGRHTGVLGIEDARSYSLYGHAASSAANDLNREGIATALQLDPQGEVEIRHVLGAFDGSRRVVGVEPAGDHLVVSFDGSTQRFAYDASFLEAAR